MKTDTRITGTLHEDIFTFMIISRSDLLRIRNVADKFVEKINEHILYSTSFPENLAICEIMWKDRVQPDRLPMTI